MRIHRALGMLIVSLATMLTACDDGGRGFGARTAPFAGPSPFAGASLFPQTIGFSSVSEFRCPSIAPFFTSFSLFIDQRGGSDVFLDQVHFQFGDHGGNRSPLLLSRSDLTAMFGSTLVPGGGTRTFAFKPQFGCGLATVPSNLFVDFITLNRSGVAHPSTLTAVLR